MMNDSTVVATENVNDFIEIPGFIIPSLRTGDKLIPLDDLADLVTDRIFSNLRLPD